MIKHYLTVFLISMVPIAELRAAIPYSQAVGLPLIPSYIIAIIGNMLPVPVIYLFARKVLEIGSNMPSIIGKFCRWCTAKGEKGGEKCGVLLAGVIMMTLSAGFFSLIQ